MLVLTGEEEKLRTHGIVTVYDPNAGTDGFLSASDEYIQEVSRDVTVSLHGQELNPETTVACEITRTYRWRWQPRRLYETLLIGAQPPG